MVIPFVCYVGYQGEKHHEKVNFSIRSDSLRPRLLPFILNQASNPDC
jgi:hypothetical protein